MAKFIVIGFPSNDKTVPGEVVYAGNDGSAADAALLAPQEGIVRKSIIRHPVYTKTRYFDAPAEAPAETPATESTESAETPATDSTDLTDSTETPATDSTEAPAPEGLAKVIGKKK